MDGTGRGTIPDKAAEAANLVDVQVKTLLPDFISVELFTGTLPVFTTTTTPTTNCASEDGSIITDKRMLSSDDTKVLDVGRISHIMIPKVCPLHTSFKRTHTTYVASTTLDVCWDSWDPKYPERVGLAWILLDTPVKSRQQDAISFDALDCGLSHLLRRGEHALQEEYFYFLLPIFS